MTDASDIALSSPRRRGRPASGVGGGEVQSLSRALSLLEKVAGHRRGVALSELAAMLDLAPSSVHRLLATLQKHGFVSVDEQRGLWSIGVQAFTVGSAFLASRDIVATARPFMQRLVEESGESVNLAVLEGGEAVFVSQVECREMMRMFVRLGARAPLHASGVGKALLAAMPDEDLERLLVTQPLQRFTPSTLTSDAALRANLARVRRRGYALDDEEHAIGLRCVAASVHDEHGAALAALSLSGPRARIHRNRLAGLGRMVCSLADEATAALGGVLPSWRRGR